MAKKFQNMHIKKSFSHYKGSFDTGSAYSTYVGIYLVTKKFYQNWTLIPHEKRLQYSGEVRTRKTPASFEGEEKGRFLTG